MCDGSLQKSKNCLIIHTQSFTKLENLLAVKQLNNKWGLSCSKLFTDTSQTKILGNKNPCEGCRNFTFSFKTLFDTINDIQTARNKKESYKHYH